MDDIDKLLDGVHVQLHFPCVSWADLSLLDELVGVSFLHDQLIWVYLVVISLEVDHRLSIAKVKGNDSHVWLDTMNLFLYIINLASLTKDLSLD